MLPLTVGGEWWGHVGFDRCGPVGDWTEEELATLEALATAVTAVVERARSEEDERLREDRFRSMVLNGPAVTYIDGIDDSASTVYISPQIEALLGYSPDDWYARAGSVASIAASGRSRPRDRRERPAQRDR